MKQDHTEETIAHTDGVQNTGNHKKEAAADALGADKFGGTRAGAGNVEPAGKTSVQSGPDVEKVQSLDSQPESDVTNAHGEHAERSPERDERGRI